MISIYIHIPFCKRICSYCDFPKMLYNPKVTMDYLEKLKSEIEDNYEKEPVRTLYIGGGTPGILSANELAKLREIVEIFDTTNIEEFTFELNIENLTEDLLNSLKEMKVTRLSIGIESFNEEKLKFMNRTNTFESTKEKISLARRLGFNNINLDLIYGIPGERFRDLKKDIKRILELNPEHISTYSLIIEEHTMCKIRNDKNIDANLELKMYNYIRRKLSKKGYIHYEISNFAKKGYESKHNLTYWNNNEYYGFGLGAAGYIKGFRYENTRSLTSYMLDKIKYEENLIGKKEMMENEIMLGLRKIHGINLEEFYDKYQVNMQDVFPIKPLLKSKELLYKNGYIFINPKYIYVMNEILIKLI